MNQIRQIQTLNKRELEAGIYDPAASWHADYRDTAFVNFGGLPYNLTEGDVLAIFSQYGEPVFLKLARDKETGKSKGFGWLKYEDQRSCDLAVDNLGGAEIAGRLVRVDHARYKSRDDEDESEFRVGWEDLKRKERQGRGEKSESESEEEEVVSRPMIQEEKELAKLIAEHDEDDPMKAFLIEEKKKEVEDALQRAEKKERKHRHRHRHRSHRSHRSGEDEKDNRDKRRSRRDATPLADDRRRGETPETRDQNDGHGTRAMTWRGVEIGIAGKIGMPMVMVNGIVIKHGIIGTIGIVAVIEGAGVDHHVRMKTDEWKEREVIALEFVEIPFPLIL
ncbi:RNA-binding protein Cwf29 [Pestalotiopsis sp. IQ-011]